MSADRATGYKPYWHYDSPGVLVLWRWVANDPRSATRSSCCGAEQQAGVASERAMVVPPGAAQGGAVDWRVPSQMERSTRRTFAEPGP